ncbi:uncharacterized protein [Watersipora subatra]|uniref:uncharacterized protein n=1 Tax=Watersipora subatra TaxID=2589382 RepID=UPI00355BBAFF
MAEISNAESVREAIQNPAPVEPALQNPAPEHDDHSPENEGNTGEREPLLGDREPLHPQRNDCNQDCTFIPAILISTILVVFEVLCEVDGNRQQDIVWFYVYRIIYYILLLIVSIVGVFLLKGYAPPQKNMHPETILLLIAAFGEFVYLYFGTVTATAGLDPVKLREMVLENHNDTRLNFRYDDKHGLERLNLICWLTLLTNFIDIFQVSLQTYFIIFSEGNLANWHQRLNGGNRKLCVFKEIVWYLCVCNFAKWISQSIFEDSLLRNSEAKTLVFSVDRRTAITQTTYPLVLFYRFHSGVMLLSMQSSSL